MTLWVIMKVWVSSRFWCLLLCKKIQFKGKKGRSDMQRGGGGATGVKDLFSIVPECYRETREETLTNEQQKSNIWSPSPGVFPLLRWKKKHPGAMDSCTCSTAKHKIFFCLWGCNSASFRNTKLRQHISPFILQHIRKGCQFYEWLGFCLPCLPSCTYPWSKQLLYIFFN